MRSLAHFLTHASCCAGVSKRAPPGGKTASWSLRGSQGTNSVTSRGAPAALPADEGDDGGEDEDAAAEEASAAK